VYEEKAKLFEVEEARQGEKSDGERAEGAEREAKQSVS
jgi:hypothetical protein